MSVPRKPTPKPFVRPNHASVQPKRVPGGAR